MHNSRLSQSHGGCSASERVGCMCVDCGPHVVEWRRTNSFTCDSFINHSILLLESDARIRLIRAMCCAVFGLCVYAVFFSAKQFRLDLGGLTIVLARKKFILQSWELEVFILDKRRSLEQKTASAQLWPVYTYSCQLCTLFPYSCLSVFHRELKKNTLVENIHLVNCAYQYEENKIF